jgi:hypothetical protein
MSNMRYLFMNRNWLDSGHGTMLTTEAQIT